MTQKVVKTAVVEIARLSELCFGDFILWGRHKVLIISVDYQNRIVTAAHPVDELKQVSAYYRIISCVEERPNTTCPGCGKIIESLSDDFDEFCSTRCKDKYDEAYVSFEEHGGIYGY